ncbi:MAG: ribonuclease P protein component [Ruminococcus sp.]|nr:ribonuclease P protein component [Ruminococcus sp.]
MLYTGKINKNKDFLTLYKKGRYIPSEYSVIYVRPNGRPYNRLGITAGKKIGNAVKRNRAKRLIRLAFRLCETDLPVGIDMVVVARSRLTEISSDEYLRYMRKKGVPAIAGCFRKMSKP